MTVATPTPIRSRPARPPQPTDPAGATRRSLSLVTVAWVFGAVWVTATAGAPLTRFAAGLGLSDFGFGLLAAAPFVASLLSLPAALLIDRTGARKAIFLVGLYGQRLMWVPIALVPLWWMSGGGGGAGWVFLALVFVMHLGQAVGGPAWMSWMADVVPPRVRGRYFSRRRQWGLVSAVPTAFLVGWLLDRYGGAGGSAELAVCALIFLGAMVFGLADIALFHAVPHAPPARRRDPLFAPLAGPLKDRRFLWFAAYVGSLVFAVGPIGQFVTLFLIERLGIGNLAVQVMLLGGPMAATLLVLPAWGHAIDRMGRKPVLAIASLGLVPVGLGWCLMRPGGGATLWLGYALSALGAALWAGVEMANMDVVMEMSGRKPAAGGDESPKPAGGSGYVAVNAVIINVAGMLGGLCFGGLLSLLKGWSWTPPAALASWTGDLGPFDALFALSAAVRLLAVVAFLPRVDEPDAAPTREAIRFMSANLYNNAFAAVLQPARFLRGRVAEAGRRRRSRRRL